VREQAAVKFFLDGGFCDVGTVASYVGVRKVNPAQVAAVQHMLVGLKDDERGQALLRQIGIDDFDIGSEVRLRALLPWLES
jgi:hypothetical protein